jgi:3-oxoacyl-[acyl-carrier protein] reductase
MDLDLKDKIAIVGGASQGIGYGIAHLLAAEGARVAITARREPGLERAAETIRAETGAEVLPIAADCRRAEDCTRVIDTVAGSLGGIDILVNNDGAPPLGEIATFDDAAWAKAVEQNLMYVVRMARGTLPHLAKRGGGSILNITAISAIQPIPGFALSVATWSAVIGFAKTLSLEVAKLNVNVNTVCPGYIETKRLEKVFAAGARTNHARQAAGRGADGPYRPVADIASLGRCWFPPRPLHHRHGGAGRWRVAQSRALRGGTMRFQIMKPSWRAAT